MPTSGWDLNILINAKLNPASLSKIRNDLQGLSKVLTVGPDFGKQVTKEVEKAAKQAKLNVSTEQISRNVSGALNAIIRALSDVNTALKNIDAVMAKAKSTAKTGVVATAQKVPPGAYGTSADLTKGIQENLKQARLQLDTAAKAVGVSFSEGIGAIGAEARTAVSTATREASSVIERESSAAFKSIQNDFITMFKGIVSRAKRGTTTDVAAVRAIPDIRSLQAAYAKGSSSRGGAKRVASGVNDVEKVLQNFVVATDADFKRLASSLVQLTNVMDEGLAVPSQRIGALVSDIKALTSRRSSRRVAVGPGNVRKFERATEDFVDNAFNTILNQMIGELDKLETEVARASSLSGKTKKEKDAIKTRMQRADEALARWSREILNFLDVIERSGRFNLNIPRLAPPGGGGRGGRGPHQRIPESEFLSSAYEGAAATIADRPRAVRGLKVATDFKNIENVVDRTNKVFEVMFDRMDTSSTSFRKDMEALIGSLRMTSDKSPVNRAELERTTQSLQRYIDQLHKLESQLKRVPGGAGTTLNVPQVPGGPEAQVREAFKVLSRQREVIAAQGAKGVDIPIRINYSDAAGGLRKLQVVMRRTGDTMEGVRVKVNREIDKLAPRQVMGQAFRRVAVWGAAAGIIYGGVSALRDALRVMLETESGLISLAKVMREADINFEAFQSRVQRFAAGAAVRFGTSIKSIYEAMRIFGQQGMNFVQTQKLVEATAVAANVSILSQSEAAEALTAATRQFGIEAGQAMSVVDAWNEIANKNAVTVKTLADATKKAGAAAKTVGIEYEQFLGLVTAIGTATRQPGKEIGTSLRFIFQRSLRPETEKTLNRYGIATRDLTGQFKGFIPLLTDIADRWDNLSKSQKLAIGQALGGARQYNVFLALMSNFGLAIKATNDAINSNGSAMDENQKVMGTAAKRFEQMRASLHNLYISFGKEILPVLKDTADGLRGLIDWFGGIDSSMKKVIATVGILTVATTKLAFQLDYLTSSSIGGGTGSLGAGLVGLLGGKGLSKQQISALPLEKTASLTPTALLAKEFADFGKSSEGVAKQLAGVKGQIVDISGKPVKTATQNMSKLTLAVRQYGVKMEGAMAASYVGITAMNSPLSKLLVLLTRIGKAPFILVFARIPGAVLSAASAIGILNKATAANIALSLRARIASAGWISTIGMMAVTAVGAAYLIGKAWDKLTKQKPPKFLGEENERKLQSEIAKREKVLKQTKQQLAWLTRLDKETSKLAKSDVSLYKSKDKLSKDDIQKKKDDILLNRIRLAQATKEAGSFILGVNPSLIKSIDEYGNAILKTEGNVRSLGESAIAAKAHVVALSRIKVASGYAKDVIKRLKDVKEAMKGVSELTPAISAMAAVFGDVGAAGIEYSEVVDGLQGKISIYKDLVNSVIEALKKIPKEAPLESFVSALANKDVQKVLQFDADQFNTQMASMQGSIKLTATAADKMNQIFLQRRGIRDAGVLGAQTAAELRKTGKAFSTTLAEMEQQGRKFVGGELIVWERDRGPFGLTQAWVTIDQEGNKVLEGIGNLKTRVRERVEDLRGYLSKATIFDVSRIKQEASESILSAAKQIAGAGAGTIKLPAQLELGAKFKFELPEMDRLQATSKNAAIAVREAFVAQRAYTNSVDEYVKQAKNAAGSRLSVAIIEQLNELGRSANLKTFVVRIMTEVDSLAKGFEKASYELEKANVGDELERQFAEVFGAISGFTKLAIDLPKLKSERPVGEILAATNPDLAIAIKASTRSVESIKTLMAGFRVMSEVDLPRLISGSAAKDRNKFTENFVKNQKATTKALQETQGDKKFAAVVKANQEVRGAIEKQTTHLGSLLEKIAGIQKKPVEIREKDSKVARANLVEAKRFQQLLLAQVTPQLKAIINPPDTTVASQAQKRTAVSGVDIIGAQFLPKVAEFGKQFRQLGLKEVPDAMAAKLQAAHIDSFRKAREYAEKKGIQIETGRKVVSRKLPGVGDFFAKEVPLVGPLFNELYSETVKIFKGPLKELDKIQKVQQSLLTRLYAGHMKVLQTPLDAYKKIIASSSKIVTTGAVPKISQQPIELRELNLRMADLINASMIDFRKYMAKAGQRILEEDAKQLVGLDRMLKTLSRAASETTGFALAMQKATQSVINMYKQAEAFASLETPIAGAGAGILPSPQLGKLPGDLTPFERVAKSVPEFARATSLQETARKSLISTSKTLYAQVLKAGDNIRELLASAKTPEQASRFNGYLSKLQEMGVALINTVSRANTAAKPFIETLSQLVNLEKVKTSLESVITSLRKMEDLEFDTTSIDIALGKHPLSPTPGVFGQPAGLDKFQRKEFEIRQKMYAPGGVTAEEMASLQLQKKQNEFAKEEALIQYKQNKENQKLSAEVNAAKRAMNILWDAQYKGISGLQPIISTLKTELETAGDTTSAFGGKKEYLGVPSLHGIQKEIARIQEKVEIKRFSKQRDIVMAPLIDLNKQMVEQLSKIEAALKEDTAKVLKSGAGGESYKDILTRFNETSQKISKFTEAGLQVLSGMSEAIRKTESKGGRDLTGFDVVRNTLEKFGSIVGDGSNAVKVSLSRLAGTLEEITEKISGINSNLVGGPRSVAAGKNVLPTKYFGGKIQKFAAGGVINGAGGIDNIRTELPVGSFILRRSAMDAIGGSDGLFDIIGSGGSGSQKNSDTVPVRVSSGEGVVFPDKAKQLGYTTLRKINTGRLQRFQDGDLVRRFYASKKPDEDKRDILIGPTTRQAITLQGLQKIRDISSDKSLSESDRLKMLNEVYSTTKYRKPVIEKPKRDLRLLGEQLGSGGGYIKVGDTILAYGDPSRVSEKYKSRKRLPKFKQAVSAYRRGSLSFQDLRKLAEGISPAYLRSTEDDLLVRSVREGARSPQEYKDRLKDVQDSAANRTKPIDKAASELELARNERKEASQEAFRKFMSLRIWQANRKAGNIAKALDVYQSAKTPLEKIKAYKDVILTQQFDAEQFAKRRADMAALLTLTSKTGNFIEGTRNLGEAKEMQRYKPLIGETYRGKATFNYMGRKIRIVRYVDPATGQVSFVDSGSIGKDGRLVDQPIRDEEGMFKYRGFRMTEGQMNKWRQSMIAFQEYTGGNKSLGEGKGIGIGTIVGIDPKTGKPVYSDKDVTHQDISTLTKEEKIERATATSTGKSSLFQRIAGTAIYTGASTAEGFYNLGKDTALTYADAIETAVSESKKTKPDETLSQKRFRIFKAVSGVGTKRVKTLGTGFANFGLQTAANLGYGQKFWETFGINLRKKGIKQQRQTLTYGVGRLNRYTSLLGSRLENKGKWEPTVESVTEGLTELAPDVALAMAGVPPGKQAVARSVPRVGRRASLLGRSRSFAQGLREFGTSAGERFRGVGRKAPLELEESGALLRTTGAAAAPTRLGGLRGRLARRAQQAADFFEGVSPGAAAKVAGKKVGKIGAGAAAAIKLSTAGLGSLFTLKGLAGVLVAAGAAGGTAAIGAAVVAYLIKKLGKGAFNRLAARLSRKPVGGFGAAGTGALELGGDIFGGAGADIAGAASSSLRRRAGAESLKAGTTGIGFNPPRPFKFAGKGEYKLGKLALDEYRERLSRLTRTQSGVIDSGSTEKLAAALDPKFKGAFSAKDLLGLPEGASLSGNITTSQAASLIKSHSRVFGSDISSKYARTALQQELTDSIAVGKGFYKHFSNLENITPSGKLLVEGLKRDVDVLKNVVEKLKRGDPVTIGSDYQDILFRVKSREKELLKRAAEDQKSTGFGKRVRALAGGGVVSGPGGPTSDSIPAMLSAGEFVIPANVVNRYGASMFENIISNKPQKLAKGGLVGGYQEGGLVSGSISEAIKSIDVFINNLIEKAKLLRTESSSAVSPGYVKTSKLPLAITQAGLPERMPDYVKASYASAKKSSGTMSAEERDFVESYEIEQAKKKALLMMGSTKTTVTDSVKTFKDTTGDALRGVGSNRGPGSGEYEIPTKESGKQNNESTGEVVKALSAALQDIFDKAEVSISADSISKLKASIEESSDTLKTKLDEVSFPGLTDTVRSAFADTELNISESSITSIGKAVSDAVSSIGEALKNATPTVTTPQGTQVTGLGAAVRPEVVEELSGKIDILQDNLESSVLQITNDYTTALNERTSTLVDDAVAEIKKQYEPRFVSSDSEIARVEAEVKVMTGLIHSLRSSVTTR